MKMLKSLKIRLPCSHHGVYRWVDRALRARCYCGPESFRGTYCHRAAERPIHLFGQVNVVRIHARFRFGGFSGLA